MTASEISCELHNVSSAFANAIRRVIGEEALVKGLDCDLADIKTDDEYIIHEMIQQRIRLIPIRQTIEVGKKLTLEVHNSQTIPIDVKTKEFKDNNKHFNTNITVLNLKPNKFIKIDCHVSQNYALSKGYGGYTLGVNAIILPLDLDPTKITTSIANPRHHLLKFISNGTMLPKDIICKAIDNIIDRLVTVKSRDPFYTTIRGQPSQAIEYSKIIYNETATIRVLIIREMLTKYPDIDHIKAKQEDDNINILIKCVGSPDDMLRDTIDACIADYKTCKANILSL